MYSSENIIEHESFNPALTFESGQVFRWRRLGSDLNEWLGVVEGKVIRVKNQSVSLVGETKKSSRFDEFISRYFSVSDDLAHIISTFPQDDLFLQASVSEFPGLRLLTQDPWECLISFVCSIDCNIPSIKQKIENLSRRFGERVFTDLDEKFYSFPSSSKLSKAEKSELLDCKLGFRWKYVKFIAKQVESGNLDLGKISDMRYIQGIEELVSQASGKTFGVGPKVADCVLLYSYHKLESFPLDVWMLKYVRAFRKVSSFRKSLTPRNYSLIANDMRKRYGEYAGYAQLFLYEKIRRDRSFIQSREQA